MVMIDRCDTHQIGYELHTHETGHVERQPSIIFVKLDGIMMSYPTLFVKHFWRQTLRKI